MEGWLTQNIVGQIWWVLLLIAANAGGFIMYVKISVKGLSDKVKAVEEVQPTRSWKILEMRFTASRMGSRFTCLGCVVQQREIISRKKDKE